MEDLSMKVSTHVIALFTVGLVASLTPTFAQRASTDSTDQYQLDQVQLQTDIRSLEAEVKQNDEAAALSLAAQQRVDRLNDDRLLRQTNRPVPAAATVIRQPGQNRAKSPRLPLPLINK